MGAVFYTFRYHQAVSSQSPSTLYAVRAEAATQTAPHQHPRKAKVVVPPELVHGIKCRTRIQRGRHCRWRSLRAGNVGCGTDIASALRPFRSCNLHWPTPVRRSLVQGTPGCIRSPARRPAYILPIFFQLEQLAQAVWNFSFLVRGLARTCIFRDVCEVLAGHPARL